MSDISLKIRAEQLGKTLDNLAPALEAEINQAVKNLAHAAHASMIATVQKMSMNEANRKTYLAALKFKDLGDDAYLIFIDGEWADKLEKGFGSYSIRQALLKSTKKVSVGKRAGEPWVRTAKDGHKWAVVPFEHKPHTGTGDLAKDMQSMMAKGVNGQVQPISQVFKNAEGKAITGKVASVLPADAPNANLAGLTKYQTVSKSGKVSSIYMTYRAVSEAGKDWVHPGFGGYQLFKEAEAFVEKEMDNIIKSLLK